MRLRVKGERIAQEAQWQNPKKTYRGRELRELGFAVVFKCDEGGFVANLIAALSLSELF